MLNMLTGEMHYRVASDEVMAIESIVKATECDRHVLHVTQAWDA